MFADAYLPDGCSQDDIDRARGDFDEPEPDEPKAFTVADWVFEAERHLMNARCSPEGSEERVGRLRLAYECVGMALAIAEQETRNAKG